MSEEMTATRPIETITAEILVYKNQAGAAILEIGRRLIEAKDQLEHGAWSAWLKDRVSFSERSAQNFMRLAREYQNPQTFADLGASKALALLDIPAEDREAFAEEVDAEHCSVRELQAAIKARQEAENQAKGWALKCEQAKAEADAARDAARKREEELKTANGVMAGLREERRELKRQVKELESRPEEVATRDAAPEQIEAAKAEARAAAQEQIDQLTAQLEAAKKSTPIVDASVRALSEINLLLRQIQTATLQIQEQLGQLDELSRVRVEGAMKVVLKKLTGGVA